MTGKRRSPGTGGVHGYQTNAGQRWYFKATVAGKRIVRRGFPNAKAAHAALHSLLSGNPGQPVGPRRSWACLVPECFDRSVTEPPALLCAEHRDLLLFQCGKRKLAHDPLVYFLRNGNQVKIGWTTNLKRRVEQLSLPMSAVAATMPGGSSEENELHHRFATARSHARREWFESTPELEAFIASLGPLGSKPGITPRDAPEITRVAS